MICWVRLRSAIVVGCETEVEIRGDKWIDQFDGFDLVLVLVSYGFVGFNLVLVSYEF